MNIKLKQRKLMNHDVEIDGIYVPILYNKGVTNFNQLIYARYLLI